MSDSNLKISLNTATTFEFELDVKGIQIGSAVVRFGLEKGGIHFLFKCTKKSGGAWSVNVPALSSFNLSEGLYKYTIEVIADGYYFAPVKGTAEVAPAAEVKGKLVKKDVKVAVSGIKVTETAKRKPVKSAKKEKQIFEKENKFNSNSKKHSRLKQLAGID